MFWKNLLPCFTTTDKIHMPAVVEHKSEQIAYKIRQEEGTFNIRKKKKTGLSEDSRPQILNMGSNNYH
jgi:hypothetical protein